MDNTDSSPIGKHSQCNEYNDIPNNMPYFGYYKAPDLVQIFGIVKERDRALLRVMVVMP